MSYNSNSVWFGEEFRFRGYTRMVTLGTAEICLPPVRLHLSVLRQPVRLNFPFAWECASHIPLFAAPGDGGQCLHFCLVLPSLGGWEEHILHTGAEPPSPSQCVCWWIRANNGCHHIIQIVGTHWWQWEESPTTYVKWHSFINSSI